MPLHALVLEQIQEIRAFLDAPGTRLMCLRRAGEMERVAGKLLASLDSQPDNPHALIPLEAKFESEPQYAGELARELFGQLDPMRAELNSLAVDLPPAQSACSASEFAEVAARIAESLPDAIGALALVLAPASVTNEADFADFVLNLTNGVESPRVKLIVFDRSIDPMIPGVRIAGSPRVVTQQVQLAPERIELEVLKDLTKGLLPPAELRQYALMAGAFASARKDYEKAEQHQQQALEAAREEGSPAAEASVLYNLGNTNLSQGKLQNAEDYLFEAAQLALAHDVTPLAAMALTNLGVTLQRQARGDEAIEVFAAARGMFKAANNRPGEAHVLDCQASVLAASGDHSGAEECWLAALRLYESISAPALLDVSQAGREDILGKLGRFYEHIGDTAKARGISELAGSAHG